VGEVDGTASTPAHVIALDGIDALIVALRERGFTVVGPTVRSQSIVYAELESAADLPAGWRDVQEGGTFRLERRDDGALFGHNVGHDSLKSFLFPSRVRVWRGRRGDGGEVAVEEQTEAPRYAFIGARSCDLHAVAIQDRVFLGDHFRERDYESRRSDAFFVAVNCGQAGGTCFCVSMGTGPRAEQGFDLALTELIDEEGHRFLVEAGSERGAEVLAGLPRRPATAGDTGAADACVERAAASMGRTLDTVDIRGLLYGNWENSRWDDVADRCLSCGNCTLVCPTCFCHTVEDVTDLAGGETERTRLWDSCFTLDHSYVHGGSVRGSGRSRYRQWMTHKLASWIDQFGSSGCVGCGRCITWCPVAIDITEETAAIRATDMREVTRAEDR
jgi:sulfhydrogenase subunit beta (sulfur reductase)